MTFPDGRQPPDPWIQVGVDASGLELRCLGNRASPFDGGEYAKTVVEGDIHWANAVNAGLAPNVPRDKSSHDHDAFRTTPRRSSMRSCMVQGPRRLD
ncbi:DNA-directed DNA polymerase [Enterobacter phage 03_vB_Eclo_IJM]|nr:DNA-directed DNA polymerase [Enterobacter phage 03_vB_Eclo_IJM]